MKNVVSLLDAIEGAPLRWPAHAIIVEEAFVVAIGLWAGIVRLPISAGMIHLAISGAKRFTPSAKQIRSSDPSYHGPFRLLRAALARCKKCSTKLGSIAQLAEPSTPRCRWRVSAAVFLFGAPRESLCGAVVRGKEKLPFPALFGVYVMEGV